jgi:hypothetical protein
VSFPINIEKGTLATVHSNKKKVATVGLIVTTPREFVDPVKKLLVGVLLGNKAIPCFIPLELRREDPDLYYKVMCRHAKFLHNHRNIQINQVFPPTFHCDVRPTLEKNKDILRIYLDPSNSRANISTTAASYLSVCAWIDEQLPKLGLSYHPTRAHRSEGSIKTSNSTPTKFSQLFKDDQSSISDSSSFDPSTIRTTRSNAWTKRPPVKIAYSSVGDEFPPLPKKQMLNGQSAPATVLTETSDDINAMIAEAVKKVEQEQAKKMDEITKAMNERIEQLEQSLSSMVTKVIEATYTSMTTSGTFSTKEDNMKLQTEVSLMNRKLDTLMEAIASTTGTLSVCSPPRKNPRTDDGTPVPSAPLTCDEAMSERED